MKSLKQGEEKHNNRHKPNMELWREVTRRQNELKKMRKEYWEAKQAGALDAAPTHRPVQPEREEAVEPTDTHRATVQKRPPAWFGLIQDLFNQSKATQATNTFGQLDIGNLQGQGMGPTVIPSSRPSLVLKGARQESANMLHIQASQVLQAQSLTRPAQLSGVAGSIWGRLLEQKNVRDGMTVNQSDMVQSIQIGVRRNTLRGKVGALRFANLMKKSKAAQLTAQQPMSTAPPSLLISSTARSESLPQTRSLASLMKEAAGLARQRGHGSDPSLPGRVAAGPMTLVGQSAAGGTSS
jgi:hypothetical protein